jgi:hypothetical protein
MNQRRGALAAIAILIPLAMNAAANSSSSRSTAQQNGKDHEKIAYTQLPAKSQEARR